jgi:hypothetical protein
MGLPVAQQVRNSQRRLRHDLRSGVVSDVINAQQDLKKRLQAGVVSDVINAQQDLKTRLGLVDQDEVDVPTARRKRGAVKNSGILNRF